MILLTFAYAGRAPCLRRACAVRVLGRQRSPPRSAMVHSRPGIVWPDELSASL